MHYPAPLLPIGENYNMTTVAVIFLKKKRILDPNSQYRKAKEPTVKLNGLTEKF